MARRFRRDGDDVVVTFDAVEVEVLRHLCAELRTLLLAPPGDPARDRLFPRAYLDPTEEEAESDWQRYVHGDLVAGRLAGLDALLATLDAATAGRSGRVGTRLHPDDVDRWLGTLNDARLALGARLGVEQDQDPDDVPRGDPDRPAWEVYAWLTHLQGGLLHVLGW